MRSREIHVTVQLLNHHDRKHVLELHASAPLLEVLDKGAHKLEVKLLPDAEHPLDQLYDLRKHGEPKLFIGDLQQPLGEFLHDEEVPPHFGIELVRAIRVNTRWRIAPEASMSPRQILDLFGLKYEEYSLYREHSAELLPLDTPLELHRGVAFEAQRDGKYGEGR